MVNLDCGKKSRRKSAGNAVFNFSGAYLEVEQLLETFFTLFTLKTDCEPLELMLPMLPLWLLVLLPGLVELAVLLSGLLGEALLPGSLVDVEVEAEAEAELFASEPLILTCWPTWSASLEVSPCS